MFDAKGLERLLALHEKTYGLFVWLNQSLRTGRRSLTTVKTPLSFSEAAAEWIRDNASNFPERFRAGPDEREEFAHLFVSYLATSFEVADRSRQSACPGCCCCVYWIESKHLRRRDPDKKARSVAHQLKVLYLRGLAVELELPLLEAELEGFATKQKDLRPQLALATYASELQRRSRFASQGEGSLALWREIAWKEGGGPKPKFRLKVEEILKAETALKERLLQT
jgi:hypothetical protein